MRMCRILSLLRFFITPPVFVMRRRCGGVRYCFAYFSLLLLLISHAPPSHYYAATLMPRLLFAAAAYFRHAMLPSHTVCHAVYCHAIDYCYHAVISPAMLISSRRFAIFAFRQLLLFFFFHALLMMPSQRDTLYAIFDDIAADTCQRCRYTLTLSLLRCRWNSAYAAYCWCWYFAATYCLHTLRAWCRQLRRRCFATLLIFCHMFYAIRRRYVYVICCRHYACCWFRHAITCHATYYDYDADITPCCWWYFDDALPCRLLRYAIAAIVITPLRHMPLMPITPGYIV